MGQQIIVLWNGFGGTGMKGVIKCVAQRVREKREMGDDSWGENAGGRI